MAGASSGDPGKNPEKECDKKSESFDGRICPYCKRVIEKGKEDFHESKLCMNINENKTKEGEDDDAPINDRGDKNNYNGSK